MNADDEQALLEQASRLPKNVPPNRDLWPGIESAIAEDIPGPAGTGSHTAWPVAAALAASLLLALAIGYGVGRGTTDDASMTDPSVLADGPGLATSEAANLQPVNLVEAAGLLETRRTMSAEIEAGLDRLPPDARSVVIENLAAIGAALDEIDAVLAEAPPSGLDRQLLMAMYVDQLTLLGSVRQLVLQSNQEILL